MGNDDSQDRNRTPAVAFVILETIDGAVNEVAADGADFICEDCGAAVFIIGTDPTPNVHVCGVCRFIRTVPDMPEDFKATLRGTDDGLSE